MKKKICIIVLYVLSAVLARVAEEQQHISSTLERHPLEDKQSWDQYRRRFLNQQTHRQLSKYVKISSESSEDVPYTIMHKKQKQHIPFAGGDTTHGIMIDA